MRLAVSSWSLRDHINRDFPCHEFPRYVKEHFGVDAVEVCQVHLVTPDARRLDLLATGLRDAGVTLVNMPLDLGDISRPDRARREHDLNLLELWIDAAAFLGCPAVRVNSGSGALPAAIASYQRLTDYATGRGVRVLLENHGGLSADPTTIQTLLDAVGPALGTAPDFGNFSEERRYDGLAIMAPRAVVAHAKTHDLDEEDRLREYDFARCLRIMTDAGYAGYLSIEYEGQGDQLAGVRRSIAFARRYVEAAGA